jgi:hypothetical protein
MWFLEERDRPGFEQAANDVELSRQYLRELVEKIDLGG